MGKHMKNSFKQFETSNSLHFQSFILLVEVKLSKHTFLACAHKISPLNSLNNLLVKELLCCCYYSPISNIDK